MARPIATLHRFSFSATSPWGLSAPGQPVSGLLMAILTLTRAGTQQNTVLVSWMNE
jgi:hypothetical protein